MSVDEGRIHSLDALRAAMMLLGLVLHSAASYVVVDLGEAWPYQDRSRSVLCDLVVVGIHVFRMPVFYVIAGFFGALLVDRRGMADFVRNRAMRIVLPFVVAWFVLMPLIVTGFAFALHRAGSPLPDSTSSLVAALFPFPESTGHLWFLYYLIWLYAVALVGLRLARLLPESLRERMHERFERLLGSAWRVPVLALPTALTLLAMPHGVLTTSVSFLIDGRTLAAYMVFFAFGWLLHRHRRRLASFERHARRQVLLAIVFGLVHLVMSGAARESGLPFSVEHCLGATAGALSVWLFIFGLTGLFVRHVTAHVPLVRYLVDASYWLYLVHLPFTIWLPGLLAPQPWPALAKALLVLTVTSTAGILSYHFFVRSTFIGLVLNGRRYPRALHRAQEQAEARSGR